MAAQNITQERLILSNLVQLFLFWAPQFALFLLPNRATSLLSILSCCLPVSLLVLLYFYIWKYFLLLQRSFACAWVPLFPSHPSPAGSLHLARTTRTATHQLLRTEHPRRHALLCPRAPRAFLPVWRERKLNQVHGRIAHSTRHTAKAFLISFPPRSPTAFGSHPHALLAPCLSWGNLTHLLLLSATIPII